MTVTDFLAIYGALLATAIAGWDVAKYFLERRRLRVTCYLADQFTPGAGVTARGLVAYSIANVGGKPIVITTIGGALRNGRRFMFVPETVELPLTLQPGESILVPGTMPTNIEEITAFIVHDALGKQWKTSTKLITKQLAQRPT